MSRPYLPIITLALVAVLAACEGSSSGETEASTSAALSDAARFNKDFRKKGCELLTAKLAGEIFGVPTAQLRQMKIMGCRYHWKSDSETLEAAISMIQAHKSEAAAARWFANATKSRTAEEMKATMEKVAEKVEKKADLDTQKKSVAKGLLATIASDAVNFEDITGIGEEARITGEGNIYVRVDNLTFIVSAYKGAKAPPPDLTLPTDGKSIDLKKITEESQIHAAQWARETAPQRKKDGSKLAKAIVARL